MRRFVAPVIAFAAVLFGTIGDTHDSSGITFLGWGVIAVAALGSAVSVWTIAKQQGQLRVKDEA